MELTDEIRDSIIVHGKHLDSNKANKYKAPVGDYVVLEWKDENGNVWTSGAYNVLSVEPDEAINNFWSFICKEKYGIIPKA